ncbi:Ig-like domain-containing protein [Aeromonas veronii]
MPIANYTFEAEALEKAMATVAVESGQLLSNSHVGDQAKSRAISLGESAVNGAINAWMGQFGTAAVSLNSAGKGSFDFLLSVLEGKEYLFYTQLGARADEERTFFNAGLGARFFQPEVMFGVNSFYDYDLTGNNRRLGLGAELWRDYLKLAANGYVRLNDWQQSSLDSMADYNERPANGFDVRLKAYLPSYPQLGANAAFEQYYGDEVALASTSDRTMNPSAISYGLEYTPFSLLTFGVGQKHSGSTHDTSATIDLNLRLGVPLAKQLDSASVGESRTLMGSRYDLVERNNTIMMDYRKQTLVTVALQASGNPVAGGMMTVTPTVVAKYGLDKVNWDAATLEMDGGRLESQGDGSLRVTLPVVAAGVLPAYTIGAVAVDKKGNRSERATLVIQMLDGGEVARPAITTLAVSKPTALANGADEIGITVFVANGLVPVAGEVVALSFSAVDEAARSGHEPQTLTTDENGQVSTVLTSTRAGHTEVTATLVAHEVNATERFAFVADEATAQHEELSVESDFATADGISTNRVKARITDLHGNPVPGIAVEFTATNGANITTPVVTDNNGVSLATLTNTSAGPSEVTAKINGLSQSVTTHFSSDPSLWIISVDDFNVDSGAVADGKTANSVSAKVMTAEGEPVEGAKVTFTVTSGEARFGDMSGGQIVHAETNAEGIATTALVSIVAGTNQVIAKVGSNQTVAKPSSFSPDESTAGIDEGKGHFTVSSGAFADGVSTNEARAMVTDEHGNLLVGIPVTFEVTGDARFGDMTGAQRVEADTGPDGIARMVLVSEVAGDNLVTANVRESATAAQASSFIGAGSIGDATITTANFEVGTGAPADGVTPNRVSAKVTDADGKPVPFAKVFFKVTEGAARFGELSNSSAVMVTANGLGVASTTLVSEVVGSNKVTAQVGDNAPLELGSHFIGTGDSATATITASNFVVDNDAVADGATPNAVKVTVTDKDDKPVAFIDVTIAVTEGAATFTETTGLKSVTLRTNGAGVVTTALVSLVAAENKVMASVGSNHIETTSRFVTDRDSAVIDETSATGFNVGTGAIADGVESNPVSATVTDKNNNPVSGMAVIFKVDGGAYFNTAEGSRLMKEVAVTTDLDGVASAELLSMQIGDNAVTATLGSQVTAPKNAEFVADTASARVEEGAFRVLRNNALPNGSDINVATLRVTDQYGSPVSGMAVGFEVDNGASIAGVEPADGKTNKSGFITIALTNDTAGPVTLTATVNKQEYKLALNFNTPGISERGLSVEVDGALADGDAKNVVRAIVTDYEGAPVPGQTVTFSATNGAALAAYSPDVPDASSRSETSGTLAVTTNDDGEAWVAITNTTSGTTFVSAALGGEHAKRTVPVNFVADADSAKLDEANVKVTDGSPADGKTANLVAVTIVDNNNNGVSGKAVTFALPAEVAEYASLKKATINTNESGVATAEIVSTRAVTVPVTVGFTNTVGERSEVTVDTRFVPDLTTATIADMELVSDESPADGETPNEAFVVIQDAHGHPLPGVRVKFAVANEEEAPEDAPLPQLVTAEVVETDEEGKASVQYTHTLAWYNVPVKATLLDTGSTADDRVLELQVDSTFVGDWKTAELQALAVLNDYAVVSDRVPNDTMYSDVIGVSAELRDQHNNIVGWHGPAVNWTTDSLTAKQSRTSTSLHEGAISGGHSVMFSNTKAGITTVSATVEVNGKIQTQSVAITFTADTSTKVSVTSDTTATANGVDKHKVIAAVTDIFGNPIANGQPVTMSSEDTVAIPTPLEATVTNGNVEFELAHTVAGDVEVILNGAGLTNERLVLHFASDFDKVTATLGRYEGPSYSEVAIKDIHPDGSDVTTPIVGATWEVALSCTTAVLAADCQPERFDYQWKRDKGGEVVNLDSETTAHRYQVKTGDQLGQLYVELTPITLSPAESR